MANKFTIVDYKVVTTVIMMTSSNDTFSVLLALCEGNPPVTGGFSSQRQVTGSFNVLFWPASEQTVEQTIGTPVIWDAIALIMTSLQWYYQYVASSHDTIQYTVQVWAHWGQDKFAAILQTIRIEFSDNSCGMILTALKYFRMIQLAISRHWCR